MKYKMNSANPFERARAINQLRREGKLPTDGKGNVITGRGEAVAKITKKLGIKPCSGCMKRRPRWNQKYPYDGNEGMFDKVLKKIAEKL